MGLASLARLGLAAGKQDWRVLLAVAQTNCNGVFVDNKCNGSKKTGRGGDWVPLSLRRVDG